MEDSKKKEIVNEFVKDNQLEAKTILVIKARPKLSVAEDDSGIELNDGYEFEVDAAVPEIADGIAKLAAELPKNGFGETSDRYFISLIGEYFNKLKQ